MIFSIFVLIISIGIALAILGFILKDWSLQLVGLAFLFICGGVLANIPVLNVLTGGVEYRSGTNTTDRYVYGDNFSGYHWDYDSPPPSCPPNNLDCVKLFHVNIEENYIYSTYDDGTSRFIGLFLMIVSLLASTVVYTRLKEENI